MTLTRTALDAGLITDHVAQLCYIANHQLPQEIFDRINTLYRSEVGPNAKEAMRQILENAVLAREKGRPMCQDTGFTVVFVEYGKDCGFKGDIEAAINKGIAKGYTENFLRNSMVKDPLFNRVNTGDNTPGIIHTRLVEGDSIKITIAPKGCGSENMSTLRMLKPAEGIEGIKKFIVESVYNAGSNPCPPIMIGLGVGGTMEKAAEMAKRSLLMPLKSPEQLKAEAPTNPMSNLALEIMELINSTGIGAQGMGGIQMCLGVNILTYPTHIAALPTAVNIQCHSARHASAVFHADGNVEYEHDHITEEQKFIPDAAGETDFIRISPPFTEEKMRGLKAGDRVLISGTIFTGRDAAHKRMYEALERGESLPVDLTNQILYYVGPAPAKDDEVIGPAGPTTAGRVDKYTPAVLEQGLKGMIGKGYRTEPVVEAMKKNGAAYFVAVGGAAVLIAQKIKQAEVVAYGDLGPEAIYKLEVEDFPVIVAIDTEGNNLYYQGRDEFSTIESAN